MAVFKSWQLKGARNDPFIISLDGFIDAAICFNTRLKCDTTLTFWTAIAKVPANLRSSRPARDLLQELAQRFFPEVWRLNEWQSQKSKYIWLSNKEDTQQLNVSITHSDQQVAVVVTKPLVGIDIECHSVSVSVANRYFHPVEKAYLSNLPELEAIKCRRLLWQLKESYIKAHQLTLFSGLKVNMLSAYLSKISLLVT